MLTLATYFFFCSQKMGNISADDFITRQMGMLTELMDNYGPVNRFWFDGGPANVKPDPQSRPAGVTSPLVYSRAAELIRSHSPSTLISPYRGDVCSTTETLYTRDQPQPNSTDSTGCVDPDESGKYFHPSEMHGITMQEGNDGNTDARPTYWFWHDWACAGNVTGCPWVGHANVSRALIQLNACPLFFWTFTFIIHICIYVGPDLYLPSPFYISPFISSFFFFFASSSPVANAPAEANTPAANDFSFFFSGRRLSTDIIHACIYMCS